MRFTLGTPSRLTQGRRFKGVRLGEPGEPGEPDSQTGGYLDELGDALGEPSK